MATIAVTYAGDDGATLTAEYVDVEAVVDSQTQLLMLVRRGLQTGGLVLDVTVVEFPQGRYARWDVVEETKASAPVPASSVTRFEVVAPAGETPEGESTSA